MRKKVKKVIKGLEKASKTHAKQAKILKSGLKVFKARGGMDASKADFSTPSGTPGASNGPAGGASSGGNYGGGGGNRGGNGGNRPTSGPPKRRIGGPDTTKDVPYKSNMLVNLAASALVPGGGAVAELGQRAKYRDRQKFARNEGLYKDFYRGTQYTTGKTLQPNSPEGKEFLKDAGYGKRPPEQKKDDNDVKCPPGYINQGGVCVKQSTTPAPTQTAAPSGPGLKPFYRFDAQGNVVSVKEGGEIEFTKSIQSKYYKDLL